VRRLLVTGFAQNGLVGSRQRKARHRIVIEAGRLPIAAIVALGTVGSVLALVAIIFRVAADARARRMLDRIPRTVTSSATCIGVASYERETGIRVMIKFGRVPSCGRMTTCTVRST
jgi:hypothetical protein